MILPYSDFMTALFRFTALMFLLMIATWDLPAHAQDAAAEGENGAEMVGVARNDVRISQLEEQMRKLQGTIEQLAYQNNQLKGQLDKSTGDIDFRLSALEKKQAANPATAPVPVTEVVPAEDTTQMKPTVDPIPESDSPGVDATNTKTSAATEKFSSSRDLYSHALKVLQEGKYDEGAQYFITFTKQYPKDPLVGNAYYWLGESYYARHDYVKAADSFSKGYEAIPTGPKASDNLLRLAMSLDAQKMDKEACVVFRRITKTANVSANVKATAEQNINRLACN